MIKFEKVELADKGWMDPLLAASDFSGCHHNFTNIFAWAENYQHQIARVNDYLVLKGANEGGVQYYFYPAGRGELKAVLEILRQDAADGGRDFVLAGVSPEDISVLDNLYPGRFTYEEMRDSFDYVYLLDKLAGLAGRKYQAKRNHINRFLENNVWSFELISPQNMDECWEMNQEWCRIHECNGDELLAQEKCAVKRCFDHYDTLGLEGGLLRSGGRVIAYTMGEILNSDTYVIHIEKAFGDIHGAYQMINREFAVWIKNRHPEMIYVNREEDMGLAGLRKAKLSYHPDKMEEKYLARFTSL